MKQTHPRLKKALTIVLITLCSLILFVALVLLGAHLLTPVIYDDFFDGAIAEFETPGLDDGLVPQGITYLEDEQLYLQCGFMNDNTAARIYIFSEAKADTPRYVKLITSDGEPYVEHVCGIATYDDIVWLTTDSQGADNCVWVLSLSELLSTPNGGSITLDKRFDPPTNASYCTVEGDYLWIGEFYRKQNYPTDPAHHFTVADGVVHHSLVAVYRIDTTAELGIADLTPACMLSVPDLAQGFAVTDEGNFVVSTSYAIASSLLYIYPTLEDLTPDATITKNGNSIPVYFLNEDTLEQVIVAPPMSEGIIVKDGRLIVLFESACKKYIFGNFMRGRPVYSIPLE